MSWPESKPVDVRAARPACRRRAARSRDAPLSGLTQTTANAWRASRAISRRRSPSRRRARTRRRESRRRRRASARAGPTRRCTPSATRRSACRPTSRRHARPRPPSAASGSRRPSSARQPCEPRAERERLDTPARSRARRAGRAAAPVRTPPSSRRCRAAARACAAPSRGCGRRGAPGRRRSRARLRTSARTSSAPPRRSRRRRCVRRSGRATAIWRISDARAGELLGRHRREVARAQQLVVAPGADLDLAAVELRPRPGRAALAARAGARGGVAPRGSGSRSRDAQEPGVERAVERLEVVAPRDERLPQRPVDVLLTREVDRVERRAARRRPAAGRPRGRPRAARGRRRRRGGRPRAARSATRRCRRARRARRRESRAGPRGT